MSGLTLTNGSADFEGGGGILNDHAILTLDSCAVKNSYAQSNGGGINNDGSGGSAALTILNSTVNLNGVSYDGGGTYNNADNGGSATLAIMNSIVSSNGAGFADNFPTGSEGGVFNGVGSVTITNSSVSGNHVDVPGPNFPTGAGGGISNYGTLTITNSTIDSNYCFLVGGGVYNNGTLTIENGPVSGNRADGQHDGQPWGHGGGIVGEVTFINSTLSGNGASLSGGDLEGGGVIKNSTISGNGNGGISTGGMEIGNTILNNNLGVNIDGTATSLGYSDDGGGNLTRPGDQINTPPLIGNLQDNGGRTFTHALLPGSPAINAGDPNFTPHL